MTDDLEKLLHLIESDMAESAGAPFVRLAAEYFHASSGPARPVSSRKRPEELATLFEGGFPEAPSELAQVVEMLERDVVRESNWLYHPRYMGHQVTAPLPAAVWTETVISALNNSVAVQEMSPAVTMVERQILRWMTGLLGWGEAAGGTHLGRDRGHVHGVAGGACPCHARCLGKRHRR